MKFGTWLDNDTALNREAESCFYKANKIVEQHEPRLHTEKDIQEAKTVLERVNKIYLALEAHLFDLEQNIEDKISAENKEIRKQDILQKKSATSSYLVQLNLIITSKCLHAFDSKSISKKAQTISEASKYLSDAKEAYKKHKEFLDQDDPEGDIPYKIGKFESELEGFAEFYLTDKNDEITSLVKQALNIRLKDRDKSYDLFQQAIDLLKPLNDPVRLFRVYMYQVMTYGDVYKDFSSNYVGQLELDYFDKFFKKQVESSKAAINLISTLPPNSFLLIANSRALHDDTVSQARYYLEFSKQAMVKKDLQKRENYLVEARRLIETGLRLPYKEPACKKEYITVLHQIMNNLNLVQKEIEEQRHQQEQAEKIKQELLQKQKEHDERADAIFDELIKLEVATTKPLSNTKKDVNRKEDKSIVSHAQLSDHENLVEEEATALDIPEEELLTPCYIDFGWKKQNKMSGVIGIDKHTSLLEEAKASGNVIEQIRAHVNLAECHRIHALRLLRCMSRKRAENAIQHLSEANANLKEAITKLNDLEQNNAIDPQILNCLQSWANDVLSTTKKLLDETVNHYENFIINLPKTLAAKRTSVIEKDGKKAWYQDKPLEQQLKHRVKAQLEELKTLNNNIQKSLTDLTQKKVKYSPRLFRSQSFNSYFDPLKCAEREEKKAGYGRR